jgi:hypothetical protein
MYSSHSSNSISLSFGNGNGGSFKTSTSMYNIGSHAPEGRDETDGIRTMAGLENSSESKTRLVRWCITQDIALDPYS